MYRRGQYQSKSVSAYRKTVLHSLAAAAVRKTNAHPGTRWIWPFAKLVGFANFRRLTEFPMQTPVASPASFSRYHDSSSFFFSNHTLFLSPSYLPFFFFVVIPLFLASSFFRFSLSFSSLLFDTFTVEEVETFPIFLLLSDSTAGSILPGKFFFVVFCGKQRRDRGTNKTATRETRLLWYAWKDSIDLVDLAR